MTHLIAPLAEPYSPQELADFEQLMLASHNDDMNIRLTARAFLAAFVNEHGRAKCDLMIAEIEKRMSIFAPRTCRTLGP